MGHLYIDCRGGREICKNGQGLILILPYSYNYLLGTNVRPWKIGFWKGSGLRPLPYRVTAFPDWTLSQYCRIEMWRVLGLWFQPFCKDKHNLSNYQLETFNNAHNYISENVYKWNGSRNNNKEETNQEKQERESFKKLNNLDDFV